jgi:hypothetical protein
LLVLAGREGILGKDDPGESTKKPSSPTEQHQRFIETARALECDEDKERFEQKLKRIATAKPKSKPNPTSKSRSRHKTVAGEQ